jgi:hypothetical protein
MRMMLALPPESLARRIAIGFAAGPIQAAVASRQPRSDR